MSEVVKSKGFLPDPEKLELLATFIDKKVNFGTSDEVQEDLRQWAENIRKVSHCILVN